MVDTDFYSFTKCQSYSPDIVAGDQTVVDNFGADCTKQIQNILAKWYNPVPTGGAVTDDMKAACNYEVVAFFKGHIKDYEAKKQWLDMHKMKLDTIEGLPKVISTADKGVVYSSSYQSSPLSESE